MRVEVQFLQTISSSSSTRNVRTLLPLIYDPAAKMQHCKQFDHANDQAISVPHTRHRAPTTDKTEGAGFRPDEEASLSDCSSAGRGDASLKAADAVSSSESSSFHTKRKREPKIRKIRRKNTS